MQFLSFLLPLFFLFHLLPTPVLTEKCVADTDSGTKSYLNCNSCNADKCTNCYSGYIVSTTDGRCNRCGGGYYSPGGATTSCSTCAAGTFSSAASSSCTSCSGGTYSAAGAAGCSSCLAGQYSNSASGATGCISCPAGTFASTAVSSASQCSSCPAGQYSASGASSCGTCSAGQYSPSGSGTCINCIAGTYSSSAGAGSCGACAGGTYSGPTATSCTNCLAGQYSAAGSSGCSTCQAGTWSSVAASSCTLCVAGTYSITSGATSVATCLPCSAGYYSNAGATKCSICPAGTYSGSSAGSCTACPAGKYSSTDGSTTCQSCLAGKYSNSGSVSCSDCFAGTYSSSSGAGSCTACPGGQVSSSGASSCTPCAAGQYSPGGISSCITCPAGKYSSASGSVLCTACAGGTYSNAGASSCTTCLDGQYSGVGSASCTTCGAGKYSSAGDSACSTCDAGQYSAGGVVSCSVCSAGTYSNAGASSCIGCSAGYYSGSGAPACLICPAGEYSNANSASCSDCPAGRYSSSGSGACSICAAGQYSSAKSASCSTCPVGTYSLQESASCTNCPSGTYQVSTGAPSLASCLSCSAGYYSNSGASSCSICSAGYYSDVGASSCEICPAGHYSSAGSGSCSICPAGQYSSSGSSSCSTCEAGQYSPEGSESCNICPGGQYSSAGAGFCLICLPGEFSDPGSSACDICQAGYHSSAGATSCALCEAGSYSFMRSENCTLCLSGTFSSYPGAISSLACLDCPEGYYSLNGSSYCSICLAGTFSFGGASVCEDCPEGQTSEAGATSCYAAADSLTTNATQVASNILSKLGSSLCVGSSMFANLGLITKLVQNIRYMKINVSDGLDNAFQTWSSNVLSWEIPEKLSSASESQTLPEVFAQYDLDSRFLVNYWSTLMTTLIGVCIFVVLKVVKFCFAEKLKGRKVMTSLLESLIMSASNFALIQVYGSLDEIVLNSILDLQFTKFSPLFSMFSAVVAVILLIIGVCILALHFWMVYRFSKLKKTSEKAENLAPLDRFLKKFESLQVLHQDYKDTTFARHSYFAFLVTRAMLSSLIIVAFYQQPLAQAIALMVLDCLMMGFLVVKGPFRDVYNELTQYFYELIVFTVHLFVLIMALADQMGKPAFNLRVKLGDFIITLNTVLFIGSMAFMCIEIYKKLIELYEAWKEYRKNKAAALLRNMKSTETGGMGLSESQQTLTNNRRRKISLSRNHTLDTASELNLTLENEVAGEGSVIRGRGEVKKSKKDFDKSKKSDKREIKSYHGSLRRRVPRELILPKDRNFSENKIHNAIVSGLNGQKEDLPLRPTKWNPGNGQSKISAQTQEEPNLKISEEDRFQTTKKKSQELLAPETDLSPFQVPKLSFESNFRKNSASENSSQTVSRQGRRRRNREITDLITYEPEPADRPKRAVSQQNKTEGRSESAQRRNERLKTREPQQSVSGQEMLRAFNNKERQEAMMQYQGYVFQTVGQFVDKVMKEEEEIEEE